MKYTPPMRFPILLSVFTGLAWAEPPPSAKGKAGDACKVDDDCDQSGGKQTCANNKCKPAEKPTPPKYPPPPT